MMFFLFQLFDVLTAIVLVLTQLDIIKPIIVVYHATYLILKGAWYWQSWMSWIDILVGIYLLTMLLGVRSNLTYLFAAYFIYKATTYFLLSD